MIKGTGNDISEDENLPKIQFEKARYIFYQLILIAAHLLIGIEIFSHARYWSQFGMDIFSIGAYMIAGLMLGIVFGLFLRSRFTIYLAIFAIVITFPVTFIFMSLSVFYPITMGLYIMGAAGLFIALEIAAIVFIYIIGKRKKSNRESQRE